MIKKNIYADILIILILSLGFLAIYRILFVIPSCCNSNINIKQSEHMINISKAPPNVKWSRNTCAYNMNQTMLDILSENKFIYTDKNKEDWMLYFPCGYDDIDQEISNITVNRAENDKKIFIVHDADKMVAKDDLWKYIVKQYGLNKATTLMPMTYVLNDNNDITKFKSEFKPTNLYILKKNIQRQEGLKITNSLDEILNAKSNGYVLVQELLQDPYTIGGRKINLRCYILVVCKDNSTDVYVYRNGFMYYTKDPFVKNSKDVGSNITTGYVDRWIYKVNPLTHDDFKEYLDKSTRINLNNAEKSIKAKGLKINKVVFDNIYKLLHDVLLAYIGKICTGDKLKTHVTFQLFGADIALDENLNAKIMEINKGPDMGAKDERDSILKHDCIRDMFRKIGILNEVNNSKNGFIRIIEYENGKLIE